MIDLIVFFSGLIFILIVPTILAIGICALIGYYLFEVFHIYTGRSFSSRYKKYFAFLLGVPFAYLLPVIHDYSPFAFLISVCFLLALGLYGVLRKYFQFGGHSPAFREPRAFHHLDDMDSAPIRPRHGGRLTPRPLKPVNIFNPYGDDDAESASATPAAPAAKQEGGLFSMFNFGSAPATGTSEIDIDVAEDIARRYLEVHAQVPKTIRARTSTRTSDGFYFEFRARQLHRITLDLTGKVTSWTPI